MTAPDGAILGVDVGSVRIGVAICEGAEVPPVPLTTIQHTSRAKDVAALVTLATERDARTIVIGYPLRLDGSAGPAAANVDRFVDALHTSYEGEVVRVDERMTSAAAEKKLRTRSSGSDLTASKRRQVVDQLAAVEILITYVARRRSRE